MKSKHRRLLPMGIICIAFLACFGAFLYNSTIVKNSYLIMTSSTSGGHEIMSKAMTSLQAYNIKRSGENTIIEKESIVSGLERTTSNNSHNNIQRLLENKVAHNKESVHKSESNNDSEWNIKQVHGDISTSQDNNASSTPIKVCIIDSGIDYNEDTNVYLRKNFIPGESDVSVIYEDLCGHGTNVAGIIAAKANDEGATGINSLVQLYSAKVLDANNQSPMSRVVEAIYWAIDQKVNIINISFGTTTDSDALRQAIKDASNAGILIIAAAGNNGVVEYPAAYDEVIAVGSVDNEGNISDYSPNDSKIELVAPGELILSTGDFGGVSVHSGTSMASPHVTGIASVLWQKDPTVSAAFIRTLLDASANLYSESVAYGYGLVDLDYALDIYDSFKVKYDKSNMESSDGNNTLNSISIVSDNPNAIEVFDDNSYVEGSWAKDVHEDFVTDSSLKAIKIGARANDLHIGGMTTYPQWHGYWQKTVGTTYVSNYMASYIYLTKIAQGWPSSGQFNPSILSGMTSNDYNGLINKVKSTTFNSIAWGTALTHDETGEPLTVNDSNIKNFLYGVALHSATDVFAHSTYTLEGNYISHTAGTTDGDGMADITDYPTSSRFNCAAKMAQLVVLHALSNDVGSVSDFYSTLYSKYDHSFYLNRCSSFASAIDWSFYSAHSSVFDYANVN